MEQIKTWKDSLNSNFIYFKSEKELVDYIKFNNINYFCIDDKNVTEHKINFAYIDISKTLYINENFYQKNKQELDKYFMQNLDFAFDIMISKHLYSEDLMKKLRGVETIVFDEGIDISPEIKEILSNKCIKLFIKDGDNIVKLFPDKMLGTSYDKIMDNYSKMICIDDDITDYENLRFIPNGKEIHFRKRMFHEPNYENICKILSALKIYKKDNFVVLYEINRKKFFESDILNNDFKNIKIIGYDLEAIKKENELLELMVSDIKNSNYSPFEKYIAVYNIVKKFKQYNANPDDEKDGTQSREVSKILVNDYMVCQGYSRLLDELLYRVGINSCEYLVSVDTSYDEGFTMQEKLVKESRHSRLIINLNDSKYGINGFYQSDPTWDNDLGFDFYNHALIGSKRNEGAKRYFFLEEIDLFFNCETLEEFNRNIKFLLKRNFKENESYSEIIAYTHIIRMIFDLLKELDPRQYNILKLKYQELREGTENYNFTLANEFLMEIGIYFVDKYGKDVPIETIIDAACVVNKDIFGFSEEELEEYKEELLFKNKLFDSSHFPYYYNDRYIK